MTDNINETLKERGNRYGDFVDHASVTQGIKRAMTVGRNWETLDDHMKEALEMIAHKIGRILNGDPAYADSWHDIIGYARLVEQDLEGEEEEVVKFTADQLDEVVAQTSEGWLQQQAFNRN